MPSGTDLQGFLRNDDHNLRAQIQHWLDEGDPKEEGPPKRPAKIVVRWREPGAVSDEPIAELPITGDNTSADLLVNDLEARILKRLGPGPVGRLRVRGWGMGSASSPGLDMTRVLIAGDGDAGTPNEALLRQLLHEERRQKREAHQALVESNGHLTTLAAEQGKTIAKLGTVRAATASAAESSGFNGLLGMAALILIAPFIGDIVKQGEDDESGFKEMIALGRVKLKHWLQKKPDPDDPAEETGDQPDVEEATEVPPVPASARSVPAEADDADDADTHQGVIVEERALTVKDVIEKAVQDPDFRKELAAGVLGNKQLRAEALSSFRG